MILNNDARLIEAILFLENEPLSTEQLSSMTGLTEIEVSQALADITDVFFSDDHGLVLSESSGFYRFAPAPNLVEKLRKCYGKKVGKGLSRTAVEILSIIAYSQPVTRRRIEEIRGINSDSMIRMLREREYIRVCGRAKAPGFPCLYETTGRFLHTFNLDSVKNLPRLSDIDRQRFEKSSEDDAIPSADD
ncbi:MAG: SMC-Scp complex subunit ScpB [Sphaerochaetaceae bacterium]|nr:SMC-Scp complex subunit ScpB [Sphaerochaetaceae bacterium]